MLKNVNGKTFYMLSQIFSQDFLQVIALILPRTNNDLLNNQLVQLSDENKALISRYLELFIDEIHYFIKSNNLENMGQAYQISKSDIPPPAPKNPRSKTCSQATANSQCSQVMSQCSQKTADMQIDEAIIRSDSETE